MASISVIIPVYNVEKYLQRCLNSIINQIFTDFEVICIDDGSTDESNEILNEFSKKDKRIKVITQKNAGVSVARNRGIEIAQGTYISFIDSDDYVDRNFLENLYNAISSTNSDVAVTSIIRIKKNKEKYRLKYNELKTYSDLQEKIDTCKIPDCSYVWNKLYKTELVKQFKFKEGVCFEDVLWLPEVIKKANQIVTVPNTHYVYFNNPNSIVQRCPSAKKQEDVYNAKKYAIEFFDENNLKLNDKERNISKKVKFICGIPLYKIKEYNNVNTVFLFSFLPLLKYQSTGKRVVLRFLGIKFTLNKNHYSDRKLIKLNEQYENGRNSNIPKVKNIVETMDTLVSTNKSITRYGDGEFNLIFGENIPYQHFSLNLQKRLIEILKSSDDNILVCIPDIFASLSSHKKDHQKFWRKYVVNYRQNIYNILDESKTYYDTNISRLYMEYLYSLNHKEYFDKLKTIWQDKDVVFVEGIGTRLGYKNDLFMDVKSIKRILCPAKDAFNDYDEILSECTKQPKNKLFILALGPTATVLSYDLSKLGYRALDLGHIDIEYEWYLRRTKNKILIKDKYVNEVKGGRNVTSIQDEKYFSEVVRDISKKVVL